MRKVMPLMLCLLLAISPVVAGAEGITSNIIMTGKVEAKDTATVYAPFGGTAGDFTLRQGDRVDKGATLLSLDTIKVYAPVEGVVRGVFAKAGDTAAFVQSQYGALCFIEPTNSLTVEATTAQRYDSAENRFLHIGETVYLKATNTNEREGKGRITALNGEVFGIEVTDGDLELRDSVNIFRDEDYDYESRIGRGTVSRLAPVAVTADGSVLSIRAREGATVRRGEVLFEMVSSTLEGMTATSSSVRAPQDGIVASVSVAPGQAVQKDQALITLYRLDQLQLVSAVSEMDAGLIAVGDPVDIVFDSLPKQRFEGTISSISGIGTMSDNYTEYAVYIDFTPDDSIRLGMSGTAYPKD